MSGINPSRSTPLHAAYDNGLHKVVTALLAAGAQVDSRDGTGATPLLCACRKVSLLICLRILYLAHVDHGTARTDVLIARDLHT